MQITVGVDGSGAARVACELVASRPWPLGTRVSLLAAVDRRGFASKSSEGASSGQALLERVLDEDAEILRSSGLAVETSVEVGGAAESIMARANEEVADLIVVGSRGRGPVESTMFGSVSAHLVDHAGCPVLVARLPHATRMLLAADGTSSSRDIPRCLASWGNAFRGLPVEVLSVSSRQGVAAPGSADMVLHQRVAEDVADELMELGWHAAAAVRPGDPSRTIVEEGEAWHADLIVTGSRGIGTLHRLVAGSVAHDVLMHAHASVLVMRGKVPARLRRFVDVVAVSGA